MYPMARSCPCGPGCGGDCTCCGPDCPVCGPSSSAPVGNYFEKNPPDMSLHPCVLQASLTQRYMDDVQPELDSMCQPMGDPTGKATDRDWDDLK